MLVLSVLVALSGNGCEGPENSSGTVRRNQPYSTTDQHPGYVYPDQAPLANRSTLIKLLRQFGTSKTIIWVMDNIDDNTPGMISQLSVERDALRSVNIRVLGLYTSSPRDWESLILPVLRGARANFTCAVIEPPAVGSIANWLTNDPKKLEPGLYVLNKYYQVIARQPATSDQAKSLVSDLIHSKTEPLTSQQAHKPTIYAQVRLIELNEGKTLARATSDSANLDILTKDLAQQLSNQIKPKSTVAVLPIRETETTKIHNPSPGSLLSDYLMKHGWPSVIGPDKTDKLLKDLDLSVMTIEFDPTGAATKVPWETVLVGSITYGDSK